MTTTAKKKAEALVDADKVDAASDPDTKHMFTFDGLRAIDPVTGEARDATFAEQVAALAPQILEQAVGIVHHAAGGSVSTKENVVTIVLEAR